MNKFYLVCSLLFNAAFCSVVKAQDNVKADSTEKYERPHFPGGDEAMLKFISDNTVYPPKALADNIEGLVVISYVVDVEGNISDFQILKSLTPETDEEAIRLVKTMPNWIPGKTNGKPVSVRFNLPIRYTIKPSLFGGKKKSKSKSKK